MSWMNQKQKRKKYCLKINVNMLSGGKEQAGYLRPYNAAV